MANPAQPFPVLLRSLVRLFLAAEEGFAIFSILYFTGAFVDLYKPDYAFLDRVDFYLPKFIVIIGSCLLVLRWKRAINVALKSKLLLLFLAIPVISTLWSDAPNKTFDASLLLVETTIFAVYLATSFTFHQQTKIFTWVFGIATVCSFMYVFALPKYGLTQTLENYGTWRGIFIQKNNMGSRMVIGGTFFLVNVFSQTKPRWIPWSCLALAMFLIVGSNSKSALVSLSFVLAISPLNRIFRWNPFVSVPLYLIVLLVGGSAATFLGMNWDAALGSIDKSPDLNGRVPIWVISIEWFFKRPWLGYGFAGFWRGWEGEGSASVLRAIMSAHGWLPMTAHNGFLELFMDLGIVGGLVFMALFFATVAHAINRIRSIPTMEGYWPLGFITYYVMINITMSFLLTPYEIFWLMFATISLTPIEQPGQLQANPDPQSYWPESFNNINTQRV